LSDWARNDESTVAKRTCSSPRVTKESWGSAEPLTAFFLEDVSKAEESKFRDFSLRLLNFHSTSEIR